MTRLFFALKDGKLLGILGNISSLGLHCPDCGSPTYNKTTCPKCKYIPKRYGETSREPIFDVWSNTEGFVFKKLFTPYQTSEKLWELIHNSHRILDERGKMYSVEEFKEYLSTCELELPEGMNEELYRSIPPIVTDNSEL